LQTPANACRIRLFGICFATHGDNEISRFPLAAG